MRRSLAFAVVLLLLVLTACGGRNDDPKAEPTARTTADGVETWDLTGPPTAEAFGLEGDRLAAVYETKDPRRVRFELPGGRDLSVDAVVVTFERFGPGEDARWTVSIRSPQVEPDDLVGRFRDALAQLDVDTAAADDLARQVAAAPGDQTERISVGSPTASFGGLRLGVQAGLAPVAGSGRLIVGGSWD